MAKRNVFTDYNLSMEDKKRLLGEIKEYFSKEREEDIGIIASENLLEFFLNTMGKYIYNKALDDTKLWFDRKIGDIESDFYENYK